MPHRPRNGRSRRLVDSHPVSATLGLKQCIFVRSKHSGENHVQCPLLIATQEPDCTLKHAQRTYEHMPKANILKLTASLGSAQKQY